MDTTCGQCGTRMTWKQGEPEHRCDRETRIQYQHVVSESHKCGLDVNTYERLMFEHRMFGNAAPEHLPTSDK